MGRGPTYRSNNTCIYALPTTGGRFVFIPYGADRALGSRDGYSSWAGIRFSHPSPADDVVPALAAAQAEVARIKASPSGKGRCSIASIAWRGSFTAAVHLGRMASDLSRFNPGDRWSSARPPRALACRDRK
jgi:hypothetical protein